MRAREALHVSQHPPQVLGVATDSPAAWSKAVLWNCERRFADDLVDRLTPPATKRLEVNTEAISDGLGIDVIREE